MTRRGIVAGWTFGAALFASVAVAHAQSGRRPALHWVRLVGADTCIDPRTLGERVESITGPVLVGAADADVSIEASIEATSAAHFVVRLKASGATHTARQERVLAFDTRDCRSLDSVIAFLIAMSVDPDLASSALAGVDWLRFDASAAADELRSELANLPPPPARDVEQETASTLTAAVANQSGVRRDATDTTLASSSSDAVNPWRLTAAVGGGYGPSPSPSLGAVLGFARTLGSTFSLGAQISGVASTEDYRVDAVRAVSSQTWGLALLPCVRVFGADADTLGMRACLGPELGLFVAHGHGFTTDRVTALPTAGAVARLELARALSRDWSVVAAALVHMHLGARSISYTALPNTIELFRPSPFAFQLALGAKRAF